MTRCYCCDRGEATRMLGHVPVCDRCARLHGSKPKRVAARPVASALDEDTQPNFSTNGLGLNLAGWQGNYP